MRPHLCCARPGHGAGWPGVERRARRPRRPGRNARATPPSNHRWRRHRRRKYAWCYSRENRDRPRFRGVMQMFAFGKKTTQLLPSQSTLPGRSTPLQVRAEHFVNRHALKPPFPGGLQRAVFGMGCFWGAERLFWKTPGVYSTAVGYAGGETQNPTYEEGCPGLTNHAEGGLGGFDPKIVSTDGWPRLSWE